MFDKINEVIHGDKQNEPPEDDPVAEKQAQLTALEQRAEALKAYQAMDPHHADNYIISQTERQIQRVRSELEALTGPKVRSEPEPVKHPVLQPSAKGAVIPSTKRPFPEEKQQEEVA